MARKPATRVEFTLFDVVYEDGSLRSNRRVPSDVLGGLDGDAAARAVIEEQDRIIAEKSGTPAVGVKSIHRSGSKDIDRTIRPSRRELASVRRELRTFRDKVALGACVADGPERANG